MSDPVHNPPRDPVQIAYQEGRRFGLATAALALSVVSFINMIGTEKAILAIAFAILARQGAEPAVAAMRRSRTALIIAVTNLIVIVVALILIWYKFGGLLTFFHKLS